MDPNYYVPSTAPWESRAEFQGRPPEGGSPNELRIVSPLGVSLFGAEAKDPAEIARKYFEERQRNVEKADGVVAPRPRMPAFRTPDLIALALAGLAGKQAGNVLGGYWQSKEAIAQQDSQRDLVEAERRRQTYLRAAQESGEKAASLLNMERGQTSVGSWISKPSGRGTPKAMNFAGVDLDGPTVNYGLSLIERNPKAVSAFEALTKQEFSQRGGVARAIRARFPDLADWDDDALSTLAQAREADVAQRAAHTAFRTKVGFAGIRSLGEGAPAEQEALLEAAERSNGYVQEELSKSGLSVRDADAIAQRSFAYEPELRRNFVRYRATIARTAGATDFKGVRDQIGGYEGAAKIAGLQLDSLKRQMKKWPEMESNPEFMRAYRQIANDQAEALEQKKALIGRLPANVRPVTQGRPIRSAPLQAIPGAATAGSSFLWREIP